jgi:hypothetical protein
MKKKNKSHRKKEKKVGKIIIPESVHQPSPGI